MCCASAALPPFPQKNSVPPRCTVSCTMRCARSRSGPNSIATRSAVAARSRRASANGEDISGSAMVEARPRSAAEKQLAEAREDARLRGQWRYGRQRLAIQQAARVRSREQGRMLGCRYLEEPLPSGGERAGVAVIVAREQVHESE